MDNEQIIELVKKWFLDLYDQGTNKYRSPTVEIKGDLEGSLQTVDIRPHKGKHGVYSETIAYTMKANGGILATKTITDYPQRIYTQCAHKVACVVVVRLINNHFVIPLSEQAHIPVLIQIWTNPEVADPFLFTTKK